MKLNLHTVGALFIIGLGAITTGVVFEEILRNLRYDSRWKLPEITFAVYGFAYLISGVLLLMRHSIARSFATFVLGTSIIAWIVLISTTVNPPRFAKFMFYYLSFMVVAIIAIFIFYINNEKVINSANDFERDAESNDDILDLDL